MTHRELIERRTGRKLAPVNREYEAGRTYWCDYWQDFHTVIEVRQDPIWGREYVSRWHKTGETTVHSTPPARRDYVVVA